MGRQVRKISPWLGMFESHGHSNHVIHRLYRWTTYHSHPTMRAGQPFKTRGTGRPYPGVLLTPDILKFQIPIPLAFVPINPSKNPRETGIKKSCCGSRKRQPLASAGDFELEQNCQKMVQNFNKCVRNNTKNAPDVCAYYLNYLNNNCKNMNQ